VDAILPYLQENPIEHQRYLTLKQTLAAFRPVFVNRRVLDFGASSGLSICALIELGAAKVVGIEPEEPRVERGQAILSNTGSADRARILHVGDTAHLPFADGSFEFVLANAVFEHIPQPRDRYIREVWRVLAPGGHFLLNETPNKYLPLDYHTTGLLFVPWLRSGIAHRYAVWRGRFRKEEDWATSGWRGLGYYELVRALPSGSTVIPERSRLRHRVFLRFGLPASLLDPYPTYLIRKEVSGSPPATSQRGILAPRGYDKIPG